MKSMMLIPTLAVALVTASASLTAALACNPPAGQCCTGDWFHENGLNCRVTQCRSTGAFGTIDRRKICLPIIDTTVHVPRPSPLGGLGNHSIPGTSGSMHQ
jgi:hypothetical protein